MMTNPTVAVVIPMYNSATSINRALNSVFQQTVLPAEVIVVDDGSTDMGNNLVMERFPNVRLITQSNAGASAARNAGMSAASSGWTAFLDADDFWLPNHLETALRIIDRFSEASFVSTGFKRWRPDLTLVVKQRSVKVGLADYFEEQSRKLGVISSSTALVKTDALAQIGSFKDIRIGEDLDMWERLALSYKFARTTEITAIYVESPMGQMSNLIRHSAQHKNFESEMYFPTNFVGISKHRGHKSKYRYQNHLRYLNVRQLLFLNQISQAKKSAKDLDGPARTQHWIFMTTVKYSPQLLLRLMIGIKKSIKLSHWKKPYTKLKSVMR
jgi:glycosyltransferase involved in cell wall biosynthesis